MAEDNLIEYKDSVNKDFEILESEIIEKFVHSSGKGGQHVNKVATCVYLKHIPTGIEVKYSGDRSQSANRAEARRILLKKIIEKSEVEQRLARYNIEKEFRRTREKPEAIKQKINRDKKIHSAKKELRKAVDFEDDL